MNGEDEEEEKEEEEKEKEKNMLTSHVNCLEETSHHVEAHGIWHMLLLNDCGIGQIEQRQHKTELCIAVCSNMTIKPQDLRYRSTLF